MSPDRCADCGAELADGLCPRCLVKFGIDGHRTRRPAPGDTLDPPPTVGSVLDTIATSIGTLPRVLLRDTAPGEPPSPIVRPVKGDEPTIRYRLDGEIARGGMGLILKGRDPDLGRDVAVKVLREDLRDNADMVRRFVEEAQIGGQLQHPGVVPIYELGTFGDRRPFFSMKLVKGQTLAALLAGRANPADELPRFLAIYATITQTMAYAHTRGVIHRDLKPSNVMVGSFGEVQVMDWGLAKVLSRGGVEDDARAGKQPQETVIATARSGSDTDLSHAGSILGTPSYMAPEQARGEVDRLDERCDVFALGSILCEFLTGRPAFEGPSTAVIVRKAARGDTADALSRIDACGADAGLIALAHDCLAPERDDRPRDASAVAGRVEDYLSGVQEKLKTSERERAVAEARAVEERKQRRLQLGLAAAVLALTMTGGLGTTYYLQQRSARAATTAKVMGEALTLRDAALAHPEDVARWQSALAAARQAERAAVADPEVEAQLGRLIVELRAGADAAERDRTLLDRLVDIRSARADDRSGASTDAAYASAFRDAGIDIASLSPAEAGAKVKSRPTAVALALAAALDDWASVRRDRRKDPAGADRLAASAEVADPDPWRNELRAALALADKDRRKGALKSLAITARYDELDAVSLDQLGKSLTEARELASAESVLRRAQRRFTGDVWVNYDLARALEQLGRRGDAIRFYTAARAVRPETAHELAHALDDGGEADEAIAVFRDLTRLRPKDGRHLGCLGGGLKKRGSTREAATVLAKAVAAHRDAIRLNPDDEIAHFGLGMALEDQGKPDEAVDALRESIRLKPDDSTTHHNLGLILHARGKFHEAISSFREAIRLEPGDSGSHLSLGVALESQGKLGEAASAYDEAIRLRPDDAKTYNNIGNARRSRGKLDAAVAALREAIRLKPDYADAHNNLGIALLAQEKFDEAVASFRDAIRLRPDAGAYSNLGNVLNRQGKLDEAVAACREAIRLEPDYYGSYDNLGNALASQGKVDEAVAAFREAFRLEPDESTAHNDLGSLLLQQRRLVEAVAEFREALRLKPEVAGGHRNLGIALIEQGKSAEAVDALRESIRLKPDDPVAQASFGVALANSGKLEEAIAAYREAIRLKPDALTQNNLGVALRGRGRFDEAVAAFRESIRLDPGFSTALSNLGALLCDEKRDFPAAEVVFRESIRLKPDDASYRYNLGNALRRQGKLDESIAAYREAIRLNPDLNSAHFNLGLAFQDQARLDEAAASFREETRIQPGHALAHCYLGLTLRALGDFDAALAMLRTGHSLGTARPGWAYPSAVWVEEAERAVALADRLPALLKGDDRPKDVVERLTLAQICHDRRLFHAAARFRAEALAADPKLGDDRNTQHRYNAACDAALAASGQGKDDPPVTNADRPKLREQARSWLAAELAAWAKILDGHPQSRPAILPILRHWQTDGDLAGLRDPAALAKLPDAERKAWQSLWKQLQILLEQR